MSQFGQAQPQPHHSQARPDQAQQGARMAGPDGVVYVVTPAGAVPAADATLSARPPEGAPRSQQPGMAAPGGIVAPCLSYAPDGIVSPCFRYSPDSLPGGTDGDAAQEALGSLPALPVTPCFSFFDGLPPSIASRRATRRALPWVRRMPEIGPCFSY